MANTPALSITWKDDDNDDYEAARIGRIFNNLHPARYPAAIVKAKSVDDVINAVKLAESRQLRITVRSGGHSWPAWSLREGSLLIDLGDLKELSFDPESGIVTASASTTGRQLNIEFLAPKGVFVAGGHCPSVALGGFLLQGGQGWNCRGWKWGAEYIRSMDVVTADGRLVTASEWENSDIFWAARGAGLGFFGVVVRFRLETRPLPKVMTKSVLVFKANAYDETFPWFQRLCPTVDLDVELVYLGLSRMRCMTGSDGDPAEPLLVISGTVWKETKEEADTALKPLLECPNIENAEFVGHMLPTSFQDEYAVQERDNPADCKYWANNGWMHGTPEQIRDSLRHAFLEMPTADSYTLYYSQAPLRKLPDMAFDMQTEHYYATYVMKVPSNPFSDEACVAWLADAFSRLDAKRGGPGGSVGQYLGDSDLSQRPARFMSEAHWERWAAVRERWDPESRFWGFGVGKGKEENLHMWEENRAGHHRL